KKTIRLPIAHGEGRYVVEEEALKKIEGEGQVWWRYKENPNGSVHDIAGVMNAKRNVVGLMPHPERALFDWMGGVDGVEFFSSVCS
ncbi:MAG: phosphoribosylformylglycinamidine synthase subunit PurQ, partial [Bdellovibrionales bacterium]|nr:phosphoribosylformylglycinamidine synthase subunit PurQ [Bdellovibrionales bacterium]